MVIKTRKVKTKEIGELPLWEIGYLEIVDKEARSFLNEEQYFHAIQLCEELTYEASPPKSQTQDVRPIQEFYELRDKGGVLGKINLRIYFVLLDEEPIGKLILILSAIKKENEGQTPKHILIRLRHRLREAKKELKNLKDKENVNNKRNK